jgi:hypothetical protein
VAKPRRVIAGEPRQYPVVRITLDGDPEQIFENALKRLRDGIQLFHDFAAVRELLPGLMTAADHMEATRAADHRLLSPGAPPDAPALVPVCPACDEPMKPYPVADPRGFICSTKTRTGCKGARDLTGHDMTPGRSREEAIDV